MAKQIIILAISFAVAGCALMTTEIDNHCASKKPIKCAAELIYIKHTWSLP